MELLIERKWKKDNYTVGNLYVNGKYFSDTLEDTDRGLSQDMNLDELKKNKVYGKTAIPKGIYTIKMTKSPSFSSKSWAKITNGFVPEVCNVPAFTGVRIHPLNTAEESFGCIGVGKNDKPGRISNSGTWYKKLVLKYIFPAYNKGETINLKII